METINVTAAEEPVSTLVSVDENAHLRALRVAAERLLPGGKPADIDGAVQLLSMARTDLDSFIETVGAIEGQIRSKRAALEEELAGDVTLAAVGRKIMLGILLERNAKILPSDSYDCQLKTSATIDKRFDVLLQLKDLQLQGKLPGDRLEKALWVDGIDIKGVDPAAVDAVIAAGAKPVFKADATQLKKLATDFGGEVAEIVKQGLRYVDDPPALIFAPKPSAARNVTPQKAIA